MKSLNLVSLSVIFTLIGICNINLIHAQDVVSPEVAAIVKMKLEDGQNKLTSLGYEICASSLFSKKQDWYNETSKNCITIKFNKKQEITEVIPISAIAECQKGLEASRKVWEKYHDGQAPISDTKIDAERKKLAEQGFTVSYWIDEVSPGRSCEYWINTSTQSTMYVVWEIPANKWVMTEKTDFKMGNNPAPKK